MVVRAIKDHFVEEAIKAIYCAKKQILKARPCMVKKADDATLKYALETHRK